MRLLWILHFFLCTVYVYGQSTDTSDSTTTSTTSGGTTTTITEPTTSSGTTTTVSTNKVTTTASNVTTTTGPTTASTTTTSTTTTTPTPAVPTSHQYACLNNTAATIPFSLYGQWCFLASERGGLSKDEKAQADCEAKCQALSTQSHLAYITSAAAWTAYTSYSQWVQTTSGNPLVAYAGNEKMWFGCSQSGGSFVWTNGAPLVYTPQSSWPTDGNTYCYIDAVWNMQWRTSSSTNYNRRYICMMDAIPAIEASELSLVANAFVTTNTPLAISVPTFWGMDISTLYQYTFGDLTNASVTNISTYSKTYAATGTYTITLKVSNAVSGAYTIKRNVTVIEACTIASVTIPAVVIGNPSVATIKLNAGSDCTVNVNLGDGSAVQTFGPFIGDISKCNTTDSRCPTNGVWTITLTYTYAATNNYPVNVTAANLYSNSAKFAYAKVQEVIAGFAITFPTTNNYYAFDSPITVYFVATAGSQMTIASSVDGNALSPIWDGVSRTGNVTITPGYLNGPGPKMIIVTATNNVSPPNTVSYACTFEYRFINFTYSPNPMAVIAAQMSTLTFTWANASHFNYTINSGDPLILIQPVFSGYAPSTIITNNAPSISYSNLMYTHGGTYTLTLSVANHIDAAQYKINVTVQVAVCCITLVVDYVGTMTTSTTPVGAMFSLIYDTSQPYPTDAVYDFNFGDTGGTLTGEPFLNQQNQSQTYTYNTYGTYTVTVTIHNLVSSITLTTTVVVVVGFMNVQFNMTRLQPYVGTELHPYYLITNEVADFTMTLAQGSNYILTMDWLDGTPSFNQTSVSSTSVTTQHAYPVAGLYKTQMTIRNAAMNETHLLPIPNAPLFVVVQDPIACFNALIVGGNVITILYTQKATGVVIQLNINTNPSCGAAIGTQPRFEIDWGDLTANTTGDLTPQPKPINFNSPHTYASSEIYNIQVTVWNEVSSYQTIIVAQVYEEVKSVDILPKYIDPVTQAQFAAKLIQPLTRTYYFPIENTVIFYATKVFGSYEQYMWTFDDGYATTTNATIDRTFTNPGTYGLSLNVQNQPTFGNVAITLIIERSTLNLTLADNSPWPRNETPFHHYHIEIGSVATDACYLFDFVDPSPLAQCRYLMYGELTTCLEFFPTIYAMVYPYPCQTAKMPVSSSKLESQVKNQSIVTIDIVHKYWTLGRKNVTLRVKNHVDDKTFPIQSYVTLGWCQFPKVIVRDLNRCLTVDSCKCFQVASQAGSNYQCPQNDPTAYIDGDRVGYMKDQIMIEADVTVNCSSSPHIWFNWTMYEITPNTASKFMMDATKVLAKGGIQYQSYSSKTLVIPPKQLPNGRFHFTLTVSPSAEVDMDRFDDSFLFMQASNLIAEFGGNLSALYVEQKSDITFDAWTESFDPDLPKENKTDLVFTFYCRRSCESWPPAKSDQSYVDWRNYSHTACDALDGYKSQGCFGATPTYPGPRPLDNPPSSSQWSFGDNAGTIVIDTTKMVANNWYTLMVVLTKGNDARIAYREIMFYVSSAKVPVLNFQCVTNCQRSFASLPYTSSGRPYQRVNPTSRFSIEAIIPDFQMTTKYVYSWDLLVRPSDKANNTFDPNKLDVVPDSDWLFKASTGRNIRTMSIEDNLWNDTFQYAGFYLRLSFWVNSNTSGIAGQYFFEFFLNQPPPTTNAHCIQYLNPGQALSQAMGIYCTGYRDLQSGDLFYFVKQMDLFTPDFWLDIGSSKTSAMPDGIIFCNPVAGLASNKYITDYKVRIVDSSGSYVEYFFSGDIRPIDEYMIAVDGNPVWAILNHTENCISCKLEDYYTLLAKQQKTGNVSSVARTFASMLNEQPNSGCIIIDCDNSTSNCSDEAYVTTMAPAPIPLDMIPPIQKALGPDWMTLSPCQLDLQLRIQIRERIMKMFNGLQIPYYASFVQVISALYTVTFVPQENNINIMKTVEYCMREGISNIDGTDPQMSLILEADTREETITQVIGVVSNMEKTANFYGKFWRDKLIKYYPDFTMEALVNEIKAAQASGDTNFTVPTDIFQSNLTAALDQATLDELYQYQTNITLIHVVLNNIYALKDNLTHYVQARKVMGESPSVLLTKNITAMYIKSPIKNLTNFVMTATDGCQFVAGDAKEMFGDLDAGEESVQAGVECAKNNPYLTDPTSKGLGGTVTLSFKNSVGILPVGNLSKPIDAFVPRTVNQSMLSPAWNITQPFDETMFVYSFGIEKHKGLSLLLYQGYINVPSDYNGTFNSTNDNTTEVPLVTTTQTIIDPLNTTEIYVSTKESRFVMFFKYWKNFGADNLYDAYCVIPRWDEGMYNQTANPNLGDPRTCTISYTDLIDNIPDDVTLTDANYESASLYVHVQSIPDGYTFKDFGTTTKISGFNKQFVPVEYTLFSLMSHCMFYDDDSKVWRIDGTEVGPNTSLTLTHCRTSHLTSFASGFSLPMNDLNLQDSGFLHLAENPIAFVFCLCIFALYLILLVWCRRKDKEDTMKAGIAPLPDNDPLDKYLYQMVFYTGSRPNAGTTSKVFFQLTGEQGETDVRLACDMARNPFRRNGIDTFIMAVPKSIGKMTVLRIWHDNTGTSPSWFLGRIQLLDVQTGEQFFFVVDNWLAVEEGDGQVERIVPVAGKGDLIEFNQLFFQKSQKNLFDGHIWFSVFRRPPRSSFTRVQRLTCCLSLIYCTMVANILFYGQAYSEHESAIISVGPISFGWTSMKIAIVSGLIVIPVNTLLVVFFRYTKPPPKKTPMKEYNDQMKYQEKQMKKEEKKKLKQLKDEQKKRAHAPIDPAMVHPQTEEEQPTSVEVTEPENPPEPVPNNKKSLEPPKVVHIDTRAKKKKFLLPHWFIYVGYVLSFITVGVAFWLIVQVAFGFGRKKALSWVIAMFVSLIQSIIFVQPIKIVIMAIIFSCLCKKPEKDEYEPEEIELLENEVYVHEMQTAAEMTDAQKRRQIMNQLKRTRNALPPELQALQAARERKMKELAMWGLVKEICFYAIFLYTLMMVAYGEKDLYGYYMFKNGQTLFLDGHAADRSNMTTYSQISKPVEFFQWAESVFLPALFPVNGLHERLKKDSNERFVVDEKGSLAGTVRFRQLRIKPNSCKIPKTFQNIIHHCRDSYSVLEEDKDSYHRKWIPLDSNNTDDKPDSHWSWLSMSQTKSNPIIAAIGNYWGSGYVADLGFTADTAYSVLYDLFANDWLDAHTRAVFVEFALFYPSTNTFLVSNLVVEFLTSGGTELGREMVPFRLNPFDGPNGVPIIIGLVCCVLFLLYFIFREVRHLIKQKKKYFLDFWNWLEALVIALLIVALVMFVYRMQIRKETIDFFGKNPDSFNNFSSPLFWEQVFSWMIYIVLFIANVKFLRILRFNRRITRIVDTLKFGWKYMLAFLMVFMLIFMAFASAAYLMFAGDILDFSTFLNTIESLWVIMLNKFDWNDFDSVNTILGPLFFIMFTILLNFILVNMFLSIVNESFAVVKHQDADKVNDYELMSFVWFKLKQSLCFGSNQIEHCDGPMYTEHQDTVERDINDCEEKIEEMVYRLQEMFKNEKMDQEMKMDWRYSNIKEEEGVIKKRFVCSD